MTQQPHTSADSTPGPLAGGGELGRLVREFDWSQTPVGPASQWPQSLKIALRIMLGSRYAMWLGWGPELTFFYNDAYARMTLGAKHPWALGRSAREVWSEIWTDIGPRAESVIRSGEATWDEGLRLFLERLGYPEETYHTFSYSPLPGDEGGVGGMLCVVTEDTERTIGERRLRTLRELAARTTDEARSTEVACQTAAQILAANSYDVPFALLYLLDGNGQRARLAGFSGVTAEMPTSPRTVQLEADSLWPFRAVAETGAGVEVTDLRKRFGPLTVGAWAEPVQRAVVLPMAKPGQTQLAGFVVVGISPRLPFDDSYRGFFDLLAGQIATAVANAQAYEEARQRAEALAELDRAKTAFFSNVSHEFRTPLTLMLGPVEDMLARSYTDLSPAAKGQMEVVHRNGLRLLRLVNSLLDFSRIEAGRVRAVFQPTDLTAFTADLVSVFRAAIERAGLQLKLFLEPLSEPVYVDREMWEKIVLNLLSNAFKFTFEGEISVSLRHSGGQVELTVRDTGTGVPAEEIPRLFERFHRIENARGRTHEGSGIGLALVQELIKLHGGTISAASVLGQGTEFTVRLPPGKEHLSPEHISESRQLTSTGSGASPYVEEALRWLPEDASGEQPTESLPAFEVLPVPAVGGDSSADRPLVLVADDNADMRQYIARLLAERYRVQAVPDGEAAWEAVGRELPELVLTDVMMPRLDGFGLLQRLRAEASTSELPVILLSARAGEESRVEGMEAGADDYLVKPFSARELLARVGAHLQMAQLRRQANEALRESEEFNRSLMESSSDCVKVLDLKGRLLFMNNLGIALMEIDDFSEFNGREYPSLWPEESRELVSATLLRGRQGENASFQAFCPTAKGTPRWWDVAVSPIRDGADQLVRLLVVSRDITSQKLAEQQLQQERDLFRVTLASIGDAVITTDVQSRITNMNAVAEELTGWPAAEAVGQPLEVVFYIVNEDTFQPVENPSERTLREGVIIGLANHTLLIRRDGTYRPIDDSAAPIRGEENEIIGAVLVFRDVTERREAEKALQESEAHFRTMADFAPTMIWVTDPSSACTYLSRGWYQYTGRTPEQDLGYGWLENIHPDDHAQTRNTFLTASQNRSPFTLDYRLRQADGEYRWMLDLGTPRFDEGGNFQGYIGTVTDVHDRWTAAESLRENERRFRTLVSQVRDYAIFMIDPQGRATSWNEGVGRVLGFEEKEFLGQDVGPIISTTEDQEQQISRVELAKAVATGSSVYERWMRRKNGEPFWAAGVITSLRNSDNELLGFMQVLRDQTERKNLEDNLRAIAAELSEANRRKTEFLATLGHELRNPLAPIRSGLELMKTLGDDPVQLQETRSVMERQTLQMVRLIDDLLDVSRITKGKLRLRTCRVSLAEVVQSAVESVTPLVQEAGQKLTISLPSQPITLHADPNRLAQVLSNLLNNASKYTPEGGHIWLTAEQHGTETLIAVRDNGIGIPAELQAGIFEMFAQIDRSLEKGYTGLGIGLTLVKSLTEMHGGNIRVYSEGPNQGSEFTLRLPVAGDQAEPVTTTEKPMVRATRHRVLVVDDNLAAANMLKLMVKMLGNEVRTAHNGQEAIQIAEDYRPDVILMDLGMPVMNGFEAARYIREQTWGRQLLLVALTGWGQEEDKERTQQAGFDHHLVKPAEPADLQALLSQHVPAAD